MINLKQLLQNIEDAKDKVGLAEGDLHNAICPILRELGVSLQYDHVSHVSVSGPNLCVEVSGSCRGSTYSNDCWFPLTIFEAEDPIAAAKAYKKKQDDQEKKTNEDRKRQQLAQLKKELGEE